MNCVYHIFCIVFRKLGVTFCDGSGSMCGGTPIVFFGRRQITNSAPTANIEAPLMASRQIPQFYQHHHHRHYTITTKTNIVLWILSSVHITEVVILSKVWNAYVVRRREC